MSASKFQPEVNVTEILNWKEAYDRDDSIIYLLERDLRIARCNRAWDSFALANDGRQALSAAVIGTNIMDVVAPALQSFYRAAYDNVARFKRNWWHTFECSSPSRARIYQMRIMPCDDERFLTINTLMSEEPWSVEPRRNFDDYAGNDGIATMCSNCRRVKRVIPPGPWDWIPELVWSGRVLTTFGLCDFCTAYHYHLR